MKPRVLFVSHGHPDVIPGGAEVFALELLEGLRADSRYEPMLLARVANSTHLGTPLGQVNGRSDQLLLHSPSEAFNYFLQSQRNKSTVSVYFRDLLRSFEPDIVHFQHTLHLGVEFLRTVHNVVPKAPIVSSEGIRNRHEEFRDRDQD